MCYLWCVERAVIYCGGMLKEMSSFSFVFELMKKPIPGDLHTALEELTWNMSHKPRWSLNTYGFMNII